MTSEVDSMETLHQRCPKKPLFGKDLLEGLGGLIIWRGLPPRLENAAGAAGGSNLEVLTPRLYKHEAGASMTFVFPV